MPLTKSTVADIDQRTKDDPEFAAAVEAELQAMRIQQELVVPGGERLQHADVRLVRRVRLWRDVGEFADGADQLEPLPEQAQRD